MRLEELTLRIGGDDVRMRFHDRLTVVSGIAGPERRELVDFLVGALTGSSALATELTYVDGVGSLVRAVADGRGGIEHLFEDGNLAPDLVAALGLDPAGFRRLISLRAADIGILPTAVGVKEPRELAEARVALATLNEELATASSARQTAEALRVELADIDEKLRVINEGESKRRFARLLIELEKVRAEAAAIQGGSESAATDERLVAAAQDVRSVGTMWRDASMRLTEAATLFGSATRLDPRALAEALEAPDEIPAELDNLVGTYELAKDRVTDLAGRLQSQAAAHLPEPSSPIVIRLARSDQDRVWAIAQLAIDTGLNLEQVSLSLGGLDAEGLAPSIVGQLEQAHTDVERAEQQVEKRKVKGVAAATGGLILAAGAVVALPVAAPLGVAGAVGAAAWSMVSPRRRLAQAKGREEDALVKAGVPSWLSFQMRRIDATIDHSQREALEIAALEHRQALAAWGRIAGDLAPDAALDLEDEIRAYAAALHDVDGTASEIEALRRQLETDAEPALEAARRSLLQACKAFGIDDADLASSMVRHQAGQATQARRQQVLEEVEEETRILGQKLEARLAELGFDDGDLAARLGGFEWAFTTANERVRARTAARPGDVVASELARLEEKVRLESRPEWSHHQITPADAEEPDVNRLRRRQLEAAAAYAAAERIVPDVERLTDRRNALERRVAVLEGSLAREQVSTPIEVSDVEPHFLARLAQVRRPGPHDETLFLMLDEPFVQLPADRKWAVMDMVERLGQQVQMLYLTDDPDVVTWARRRVMSGSITLLEPVAESV
ncbi:MAG: hypothetical protein QOG03_223 [Actinomycetota bacterium]|nr:hypothetical protein [Actinomycetota bacterium]